VNDFQSLRKVAESHIEKSSGYDLDNISIDELKTIVHELKVHQIELEMQNEELLQTQVKLNKAKEQYQDLFELAPFGYLTINERAFIKEANYATCRLLLAEKEQLFKQTLYNYTLKSHQSVLHRHIQAVINNKAPRRDEIKIERIDGYVFSALIESYYVNSSDGQEKLIRLVITDVNELIMMRQEAEAANQAKSTFLAKMSHELRTPMHGVLGFALLGNKKAEKESVNILKGYFENIHISAKRLLYLLDDLLDLSKLEAGKMELQIKETQIDVMIQACCSNLQAKLSERKLSVVIEKSNQLTWVWCDRIRIEQVIINILSNAIKYSPEAGTIFFDFDATSNDKLKISVRDEGVGIEAGHEAKIFCAFLQDEKDKQLSCIRGTGLGLAICKEIVQLHGEKIWAKSRQEVSGGFFCFTLPLARKVNLA